MFVILLHSSKTMKALNAQAAVSKPQYEAEARTLVDEASRLSVAELARGMKVSKKLAQTTLDQFKAWPHAGQTAAIDAFVGDIYSGLQAATMSADDRAYAQNALVILSGLYGILRPEDGIRPYRLEMGYRFAAGPLHNLYTFWGSKLASALPASRTIINTSSAEYTKALLPQLDSPRVITPKFFTMSSKTLQPTNVTVHTKIARGAYARWLIVHRIEDETRLSEFAEIGYRYDASRSTKTEPAYVADTFGGIGLSVRLR